MTTLNDYRNERLRKLEEIKSLGKSRINEYVSLKRAIAGCFI